MKNDFKIDGLFYVSLQLVFTLLIIVAIFSENEIEFLNKVPSIIVGWVFFIITTAITMWAVEVTIKEALLAFRGKRKRDELDHHRLVELPPDAEHDTEPIPSPQMQRLS